MSQPSDRKARILYKERLNSYPLMRSLLSGVCAFEYWNTKTEQSDPTYVMAFRRDRRCHSRAQFDRYPRVPPRLQPPWPTLAQCQTQKKHSGILIAAQRLHCRIVKPLISSTGQTKATSKSNPTQPRAKFLGLNHVSLMH